ncbi:MAG: hypothetical protein JSV32_07175 [Dehalococcoidia bacterium]|nr:MAG: hypothetical protein JSV32_07175 [Dehalococcoidia bacterium]
MSITIRAKLFLPAFLFMLAIILSSCGTVSKVDIAAKDTVTQSNQTTPASIGTKTTNTEPATFSVSDLTIEPREVQTSEFFSISVLVTNDGGSYGSYDAILYIDCIDTTDPENVIITPIDIITKSVTIAAGESKMATFDSLSLQDGLYTATVGNLLDYFEVGC